jgi:hypothetical protein
MWPFTATNKSLAARYTAALLAAFMLTACGQQTSDSGPDPASLKRQVQEMTETLYWVHLRLDTVMEELEQAEASLDAGDPATAGYHVAEANRAVLKADEKVLELGGELQQMAGLDIGRP